MFKPETLEYEDDLYTEVVILNCPMNITHSSCAVKTIYAK